MSELLTTFQDRRIDKTQSNNKIAEYVFNSKAVNTIKAYQSDWKHYNNWCDSQGLPSLPANTETIGLYLTTFAEIHKIATIQRHLTAIREAHKAVGYDTKFMDDATLKALWKGIKRTNGVNQSQKAPLLTIDFISRYKFSQSLKGKRDRALILLGFAGAFRRSELVSLNIQDITETSSGYEIVLRHSKTDQEGMGMIKAIPYGSHPELCPVRSLKTWMSELGRSIGPLFVSVRKGGMLTENRLSDKAVSLVIKDLVSETGANAADYSGHSLRIGFVTQAAMNGASDRAIMNQTGHKSRAMVDRYIRRVTVWQDNAVTQLGL